MAAQSMRAVRAATAADVVALLAHRPRLDALNGRYLERWGGGDQLDDGVFAMPYPVYPTAVAEFFTAAAKEPWAHYEYDPIGSGAMIRETGFISRASLDDVRRMLTWCVRGERFCDGHWANVLDTGIVFQLLDRLRVLLENGELKTPVK